MQNELISYIGMGSNLGESRSSLRTALCHLDQWSEKPLLVSSLWRTAPLDCPPGSGDFYNAVVGLCPKPDLHPLGLLHELQALERAAGRRPKKILNESRPLDLDLLAWGQITCDSAELALPHPRAHLRRFVLAPWAEIAPDLVLPGQHSSIRELLHGLTDQGDCHAVESLRG